MGTDAIGPGSYHQDTAFCGASRIVNHAVENTSLGCHLDC